MIDRTAITDHETSASAERFVIVLRDAGGSEVNVGRRVAGLLKSALRAWHLRCVSVSDTTPEQQLAEARAEVLRLEAEVERLKRKARRREPATA